MSEIVTNKIRFFSDAISAPSEDAAVSVGDDSDSNDSSSRGKRRSITKFSVLLAQEAWEGDE